MSPTSCDEPAVNEPNANPQVRKSSRYCMQYVEVLGKTPGGSQMECKTCGLRGCIPESIYKAMVDKLRSRI